MPNEKKGGFFGKFFGSGNKNESNQERPVQKPSQSPEEEIIGKIIGETQITRLVATSNRAYADYRIEPANARERGQNPIEESVYFRNYYSEFTDDSIQPDTLQQANLQLEQGIHLNFQALTNGRPLIELSRTRRRRVGQARRGVRGTANDFETIPRYEDFASFKNVPPGNSSEQTEYDLRGRPIRQKSEADQRTAKLEELEDSFTGMGIDRDSQQLQEFTEGLVEVAVHLAVKMTQGNEYYLVVTLSNPTSDVTLTLGKTKGKITKIELHPDRSKDYYEQRRQKAQGAFQEITDPAKQQEFLQKNWQLSSTQLANGVDILGTIKKIKDAPTNGAVAFTPDMIVTN